MKIEIKNYRCIPDSNPLRLDFDLGQTIAFVGPNNSGKSAVLGFFYEFRPLPHGITFLGISPRWPLVLKFCPKSPINPVKDYFQNSICGRHHA